MLVSIWIGLSVSAVCDQVSA